MASGELGRAARDRVPLSGHADWLPDDDRPDPVPVLAAQAQTRVADLVPIRYARMLMSPFAFFRGAAAIMAADLAGTPTSGVVTQLCGDAHLSNFGAFGSPERHLVFDINDFDETTPGPWEWDVKRLATSVAVAARGNGVGRGERGDIVAAAVGGYRQAMAAFAEMGELAVWYAHADLAELGPLLAAQLSAARRRRSSRAQATVRTHDHTQSAAKLTAVVDGRRRIVADPPLIVPLRDLLPDADRGRIVDHVRELMEHYRRSLPAERRYLFDAFEFVDVAREVVGVGGVGTRCWVVLMRGRDDNDPLLLQVKEAQPSVLVPYVADFGPLLRHRHDGQRVVAGQHLMQAVGDIFLGWHSADGFDGRRRDFYVRQLRDWKGAAVPEEMDPPTLRLYGELCGWTLARAHARTGDRFAIAAYIGDDETFDLALAEFAERYADRTERDHAQLAEAARRGSVPSMAAT
ncbi:DUF2252 domain-containing protein [Virgisporangium ochraceum]